MKKFLPLTLLLFIFLLSFNQLGSEETSSFPSLKFRIGAELEILKRSLWWSEQEETTSLNAYLTLFRFETEFLDGYNLALVAGYSSSDFHSLIFRNLPFSIDLEVGGLAGSLFGVELSKLFVLNFLALGGRTRLISYTGQEKKWPIPDLVVEGEIKTQPNWKQISVGPIFGYNGYENFFPYISLEYNHFWGQFKMREIIENLTGSETKEIKSRGKIALALGANFLISSYFFIGGEAKFIPHKDGQNWSLNFKGIFSF